MNRRLFAVFATLTNIIALAQTDVDAIRYSQTQAYGDARFMAMGGAFGSLGANVSCMNYNPAGIAMYRKGEFVFTPGVQLQTADATHYGTGATDFSSKLNISNIGFVAAWDQQQGGYQSNSQPYNNGGRGGYGPGYGGGRNRRQQPPPRQNSTPSSHRWALGIDYNRISDFNSHTTINGYVPAANSIMSSMASAANGYAQNNLNPFYEGLGYNTYLINPITSNGQNVDTTGTSTQYQGLNTFPTPVAGAMIQQTKTIQSSGRTGELAFALAHSFSDKFYIGGTLGIPIIKYNYQSTLTEYDYKNVNPYFQSLQYQENVSTSGAGVNFKLGGIYRFNSGLKVGLYGQTASYYKLTDNYQNSLTANLKGTLDSASGTATSPAGSYTYKLRTPGRAGVSVSYVFKKLLAVSVDGEYVNYSNARLSDNAGSFDGVNQTIQQKYTGTANIKAGAELNIRPVVFRVGVASYGSPFGNVLSGQFVRNSLSGGIGFRGAHKVYLDLGFVYTMWSETYYVIDPSFVNPSNINYAKTYITATLGIKFN
jgi:hypothetical protein